MAPCMCRTPQAALEVFDIVHVDLPIDVPLTVVDYEMPIALGELNVRAKRIGVHGRAGRNVLENVRLDRGLEPTIRSRCNLFN